MAILPSSFFPFGNTKTVFAGIEEWWFAQKF